jgi:3-dehydroquinate synthase
MPEPEDLFALMGQDKKVVAGQLNFIMARDIGQAFVTADVSEAVILSVLEASIGPPSA